MGFPYNIMDGDCRIGRANCLDLADLKIAASLRWSLVRSARHENAEVTALDTGVLGVRVQLATVPAQVRSQKAKNRR